MSPPIRDGSGNDIGAIRLGDGSEISEVRTGAGDVLFSGSAIPDSVVSREPDNSSFTNENSYGIEFTTAVEWSKIGAELSANTSGATTAYVIQADSSTVMGQTDISSLSGGDTFTIDLDTPLNAGGTYDISIDANGSTYTVGHDDSSTYPYTSSDGVLEITTGVRTGDNTEVPESAYSIRRLGDVGF